MQTNKWSVAATYAIILALVTIAYSVISTVFTLPTAITVVLWIIKFTLSIWLVYYFIKEYSKTFETFTYKQGFNFGFILCFLSAIVCAAYMFMHYAFLFPDAVNAQMELMASNMQSSNPEASETISKIMPHLPKIIFLFSVIYYTLFGVLVSSIIANYTKKGDIFTE
ncbi:MAG: hypothetical protein ACD_77C00183G0005 [uncultured bacterium]|nr:MAG: hypothetical protein ACD_77C00183G0005 [uncultured bacterium]HBY02228.1 hypothetical protein [Rikenellaceae bacterium]